MLNDSCMLLALADSYFLFLEEHYVGVPISLSLYWPGNHTSDAFSITLNPLPAPQVLSYYSWYADTVINANGTEAFPYCVPEQTLILMTGRFLLNMSVTVGGQEVCWPNRAPP